MKTKILSLLLAVGLLLPGCVVQSLHVFYSTETRVEVPQILGEWVSEVQMGEELTGKTVTPWRFTEDRIETYDSDNVYSQLEVVYFKLGDVLFADFTAGEPHKDKDLEANMFWASVVTQVHSVLRVDLTGDTLVLTPLDFEWILKRIKEHKLGLAYVQPDPASDAVVFTATTKEWEAFLNAHAANKEAFSPKGRFVFRKKK